MPARTYRRIQTTQQISPCRGLIFDLGLCLLGVALLARGLNLDSRRKGIGDARQAWLHWCLRQCDKRGKRKRPADARSATCVPICICGGTGCATGMTSCFCMVDFSRVESRIVFARGVQTATLRGGEGVSGEMGGDSLFFDYDCPLRTKKRDDIVLDIDWSTRAGEPAPRAQGDSWLCSPADRASPGAGESESPKLVVGTSDNRLSLFQDEGHPVETMEPPARESSPTCVSWGPAPHHLLAAGWHDGAVTLWDEKTSMMRQDLEVHKRSSVTLLKWSPCGSRLVSADQVSGSWLSPCDASGGNLPPAARK